MPQRERKTPETYTTATSTQAMHPYQGFSFAQFAAALPNARTPPNVYPPGVAPAAAPGYEQYMAQMQPR